MQKQFTFHLILTLGTHCSRTYMSNSRPLYQDNNLYLSGLACRYFASAPLILQIPDCIVIVKFLASGIICGKPIMTSLIRFLESKMKPQVGGACGHHVGCALLFPKPDTPKTGMGLCWGTPKETWLLKLAQPTLCYCVNSKLG